MKGESLYLEVKRTIKSWSLTARAEFKVKVSQAMIGEQTKGQTQNWRCWLLKNFAYNWVLILNSDAELLQRVAQACI